MIKLTDATAFELDTLLKHTIIGILYLEQDELRGDIKFKTDKKYRELEALRLWKVQILNALHYVTERENIQSN